MKKYLLTEGVIIALATAELYAVAFAYEAGYLSYFDIPGHLVRPSVTTIVLAIIACVTSVSSALKLFNFATPLFRMLVSDKHARWRPVIAFNCFILLPSLFVIAIYPWSWILASWLSGAALVVNLIYFGIPLILNLLSEEKLPADQAIRKALRDDDPLDFQQWLMERGCREYVKLVFGFLLLVGLGWIVGNATAMKEQYFDILDGPSPQIVLRSYESYLLTKPVEVKEQTFDMRYQIVPIGDSILKFAKVKIGKIKLKENLEPEKDTESKKAPELAKETAPAKAPEPPKVQEPMKAPEPPKLQEPEKDMNLKKAPEH